MRAIVLLVAGLGTAPAVWAQVWGAEQDNRPRITVRGEATVYVKPDLVVASLGIQTADADVSVALEENNRIRKQVLEALRSCGVQDKFIETGSVAVTPRWWGYRDSRAEVRSSISVTLKEPERVTEVITAAVKAGANCVHGVDFRTNELRKYRDEARRLALKAAREKAEKMAGALGQSVGKPLMITEGYVPNYYYWSAWSSRLWAQSSRGTSQVQVQVAGDTGLDESGSIALGKITIRATVTVSFELTDR